MRWKLRQGLCWQMLIPFSMPYLWPDISRGFMNVSVQGSWFRKKSRLEPHYCLYLPAPSLGDLPIHRTSPFCPSRSHRSTAGSDSSRGECSDAQAATSPGSRQDMTCPSIPAHLRQVTSALQTPTTRPQLSQKVFHTSPHC